MMAESTAKPKRFRMADAILSVICIVFVCEAAAPAAAIGNAQFFWWIFLMVAFLLPYGMIVSELGSTYDDEGGLFDWVRRAFGDAWGARVSWYYWINYPLGLPPWPCCSSRHFPRLWEVLSSQCLWLLSWNWRSSGP